MMSGEQEIRRNAIDDFAIALASQVVRFRWLVVIVAVALLVGLSMGASRLGYSNNYREFFSAENPELQTFDQFQKTYTKTDSLLFVIVPQDGTDVYDRRTLRAIRTLTDEAWAGPYVQRVDSLTNFQYTYADGDELIVEELFEDIDPLSDDDIAAKRDAAANEPLLNNLIVTPDAGASVVSLSLNYPEQSLTEVPEAVAYARALREQIETDYPHLQIYLTGSTMLNNAFGEAVRQDFKTLVPAMVVIIFLTTGLAIRSFWATLAVVLLVILSMAGAMGWAGFVGIKLAGPSPSATIVILTLAIADAMHILVTARGAMRAGLEKRAAIIESIRVNFLAVLITSITTIVGFLALNFSDAPPFRDLGNISAVGIALAWVLSITFLPALLMILPFRASVRPKEGAAGGPALLGALGAFIVRFWVPLFVVSGLFGAVLIALIPKIELSDSYGTYFSEVIEFRRDTDKAGSYFGTYTVDLSIPAGEPGGVTEPAYLKTVADFAAWIEQQPAITHVYALPDIMKRLNRNLNGDDPAFHRLPDDRDLAAQYLLLFELSLPYGLDLNDRISIDKSASRLTASVASDVTTKQSRALFRDIDAWFAENAPQYAAKPTGPQVMFTFIAQRNVESMIRGTIIAIILIAIIMAISLQSPGLGLLSVIPNGLPVLAAFGVWALLIGQVGFSVAAVAALSLGIVIDDTVHILTKFNRARREYGLSTRDSIQYSIETVGQAVLLNTLVLMLGFGILMFSSFQINFELGLLTTLTIGLAALFDFFFLPGLLILTQRDRPNSGASSGASSGATKPQKTGPATAQTA